MQRLIFRLVFIILEIGKVSGVVEVISTSFQGNDFQDADGWIVSGAEAQITNCMGIRMFGGQNAFGNRVSANKIFELPPHYKLNLKVQFWKIDQYDNEFGYIYIDQDLVWQQQFQQQDGTQMCGSEVDWKDQSVNLDLTVQHSGSTAIVVFTSTLDEWAYNESWGFREFILSIEKCPEGCLICSQDETVLQCSFWIPFSNSWGQLNKEEITGDGWTVFSGIAESTKCGAVSLFGGQYKTGRQTLVTKTLTDIPNHSKIKITFLFAMLNSWNNEFARLTVDNQVVWERQFNLIQGYYNAICNFFFWNLQLFVRVDITLDHTNQQVQLEFSTTLNDIFNTKSFGLRDFSLYYYLTCPENCIQCTEESCKVCASGYYNSGIQDQMCQKCHESCQECVGITNEDCTYCGDSQINNKHLVEGQCQCVARTIQQLQNDNTILCLPCHPNCEKCYKPQDNTVNQYCTMCKAGQNRQVSDDLNCICKQGYGENGISEICVLCHYTCQTCKGPLSTDCISCSSQNNRHLTSNNECLCNKAYVELGNQNPMCLFICDHTCSDCDISGVDKCTSCPSTRIPDRIGSTFKCQCKDPHYFSDDFQLECQQCHSTCKTCNGMYDNNCLTCDIAYRQLVMFKCICPYGYYDIGTLQCSPCHYTCMTCYGPLENNCITCDTTNNNRIVKANKCVCNDQYIEKQNGDPICQKCSYRCNNCIGTIDTCDSCPPQSYRDLGTNQQCLCPVRSYDQPNNPICIICHETCLTCNGSKSNQCQTCNTQIKRQLNDLNECVCSSKYYDAGLQECQACSIYCLNCVSTADKCLSCKIDRYLQDNACLCLTKLNGAQVSTYQAQGQSVCQSCHYSCLNCNGPTANKCTSCLDSEQRYLLNSSCLCAPHYFDVGKPKCLQCNYACQTCSFLDTTCLTCYPFSFRILTNQQCICQNGYFDDGFNANCQKCHYSCFQCRSFSTKCDSCSLNSNRKYDEILFSCICQDSYFDSGVETCQKCHYSCLTCNSIGPLSCKSCLDKTISFRVINGGKCECLFGYYDNGSSQNCLKCSIYCLTCQNTAESCTSCTSTRHLEQNKCVCDTGYFDKMLETCVKCDSNCVNCVQSPKNCIECDLSQLRAYDNITHSCSCMIGTTDVNGICQYCDINCLTCVNSTDNCSSCKTLKILINNKCQCIQGTYETGIDKQCLNCNPTCLTCINQENYCISCSADKYRIFKTGNICVCQDGYYEDQVTFQCKQCDFSCLTCKFSSKNCLSCDSKINLSLDLQNRCVCSPSYFLNSTTKICEACNITCKECNSSTQCIECEYLTRYLDSENFKCPCKDGYFESNLRKCSICDVTCKTCFNQATKCKSCEPIYLRILNNQNQCICQDGYYDVGIEMCQSCNKQCKTCQMAAKKCFSCYETQQFRYLSANQCICKSGYFDNGQLICEKCSNSCLTCLSKKDNCTSCDINQNRVDLSPIKRCPCTSGFYQDENEICLKCGVKCSTCSSSKDNCLSCQISKTSNRFSISKNCDCKEGYYDDDIQLDCQKCSPRCKTCSITSNNCLICSINLREKSPQCNCKDGFFENSSIDCEVCENQCNTCEISSSNCLTCKEGRYTQKCLCQEGYFEGGQPLCLQCSFQCKTCQSSPLNCLTCKGDRQTIPYCICLDGFYDDFQNESCQVCNSLCKTCNLDGCLSCNGNRILTTEMECESPPNSVIHSETPWCSTCNVAVMDARFSDDLLSISVKFDFPLNPNFFTTQFQDNICFKILDEITYQKLGKNPNCYLDPDDFTRLILEVGYEVSINPGDEILFLDHQFGHQDCDKKLDVFIFNQVKNPLNPVFPIIFYDLPTYILNPCDDNTVLVKSKIFDGLRKFIGVIWTYQVQGENGNGNLESFVTSQTSLQNLELNIPFQTMPKQSNITFIIEFQNFVKQKSIQKIKVQTHSGQFPTILWISKPQYYSFETIILQFQIKKKDCSETAVVQLDNSKYQVSLIEVYRNESNSRPSRVKYSEVTTQNSFNVTIQNYTLTSRIAYTFSQTTIDALLNFSITRNITLEINAGGIVCQFNGTKKIQNYRKDAYVYISCRDLDAQYGWNEDSLIQLNVTCIDLTMNSLCMDINKKLIKINQTQSTHIIQKQTVQPYTIQSWQVIAQKRQYQYSFKQNIVYLDNDFKLLDLTYSKGYIMRSINNYENLKFTINIPFEDRQYLLQYQVAIIYNFELITILNSYYFQYQFRIFDYYQKFDKGKQINLKFLAQFTNEIIPSQEDLQITLNLPPSCLVTMEQQSFIALQPCKIITICDFSKNTPFMYQLRYFVYYQDYLDYVDRRQDYSLVLNEYQYSNTFEVIFPFSQGHLLIQVMDSHGSYLNIEKTINLTKIELNCSDINLNKLVYRKQVVLMIEILLNHYNQKYCKFISEQLYSNIKTQLRAENIYDQLLVYQVAKLYKRFILNDLNSSSENRMLSISNKDSCFENSTKRFFISNSNFTNILSNDTAENLEPELQQIKLLSKKLYLKQAQIIAELNQDDIFYDEKLYQQKEAVSMSLSNLLQFIDDVFVKISLASISSDQDSKKIIYIAEELIKLIDKVSQQNTNQIDVNGPPFTINGQILDIQLSRLTKDNFNQEFNIENDVLDGLIDFVWKQQLSLKYNYHIFSQNLSTDLKLILNKSLLEIDQSVLKRTNLQNHLYDNNFIEYQATPQNYIIDMVKYRYCNDEIPEQQIQTLICIQVNQNEQVHNCDLQVQELDYATIQISCKCDQFGSIFLARYPNNSFVKQNIQEQVNQNIINDSDLKIDEYPILLFHGVFIAFSCFLYFELACLEFRYDYRNKYDGNILESSTDDITQTKKNLLFYPGCLVIYQKMFKHLHEFISLFYIESSNITKSFRFLQLSIKFSILIPFSYFEALYQHQITIYVCLFINSLFYLLTRMIFKIFQSFYRFGGKFSIFIVGTYLLIHLFCYLFFIILLKQYKGDKNEINFNVSIIFVVSIFIWYTILDPILIFLRILISKHVTSEIRNSIISPIGQFLYFFIENEKLDELSLQYVIM